jgi:hypothetical protein
MLARLLILILAIVAAQSVLQAQTQEPVLVHEFGRINSEEISAFMDYVTIQFHEDPKLLVQLVLSRGETESFGSPYRLYGLMKTYLLHRKVDIKRIIPTFCKARSMPKGQIWLVRAGGPIQVCERDDIVVTATTLFDKAPASTGRGPLEYCCIVDLFGKFAAAESTVAFAELLKRYPESQAYVFAYGGTNVYWTSNSRGRERTVRSLDNHKDIADLSRRTRRILMQQGIKASRIVTKNAGYRDGVAEIEMWIVPKGSITPKATPNYSRRRPGK